LEFPGVRSSNSPTTSSKIIVQPNKTIPDKHQSILLWAQLDIFSDDNEVYVIIRKIIITRTFSPRNQNKHTMQQIEKLSQAILLSIGAGVFTASACSQDNPDTAAKATTETTTEATMNLPTIPTADYPECAGESSDEMGQCCVDVYCINPTTDGECLVPSANSAWDDATTITGQNLGSGWCLCENPEGPYSNEGAEQYTTTTGDCCYLVGIASCAGRPLLVAGEIKMAPLRRGKRWNA